MGFVTIDVRMIADNLELGSSQLSLLADVAGLAARSSNVEEFFAALSELLRENGAAAGTLVWFTDSDLKPEYSATGPGWTGITPEQAIRQTESWLWDRRLNDAEALGAEEAILEPKAIRVLSPSLQVHGMGAALLTLTCGGGGYLRILLGSDPPQNLQPESIQVFRALAGVLVAALDRIRSEAEKKAVQRQVLEAKKHWESTVDALPQLTAVLDRSGRIVRINRAVEKWSLGSVRTSTGLCVHDLLHPECPSAECSVAAHWKQLWARMNTDGFGMVEIRDPLTGAEFEFSLTRNRSQGPAASARGHAFLVVDDVSERRQAERTLQFFNQELKRQVDEKTETLSSVNRRLGQQVADHLRDKALLRAAQERYACLVESTLIGIYLVQDDRIRFANRRFAEMFGYSGSELEGRDIRSLLSFGGFPEAPEGDGAGDPAEGIVFHEQVVRGLCKDGSQVWLQMSIAPIRWHEENMILGNLMDITAQVEGELELRESEREQQRLSAELVSAQEAERLRIASELHDGIGQILSVIKLGIENLAKGLDGELVQRHQRNFKSLISMTRHATEEVRRISMDLHPAMLEDLGLVSTIDWFCREYRKVLPEIEIAKRVEFDEQELDAEQKIAAFRILQEAFNNIGKHAGAERIDLRLRSGKGSIKLKIKDDGAGFVTGGGSASEPGFGLRSMKQRAQLTGGRLSVKSRPGRGTIIRAEWPVRDAPEGSGSD